MSASLCCDSWREIETLSRTRLASRILPCMRSQRGDSGIARTIITKKAEGIMPIPSMNRQLK